MPNPYVQVALTYPRRWWSISNSLTFFCIFFAAIVSCTVGRASTSIAFAIALIAFCVIGPSIALALHMRQQFADSRSHLMPGFRRVHATVATVVILIVAVLLPAAVSWLVGLRSAGLVAVVLLLLSAVLWLVLLAPARLSVLLAVSLGIGYVASFTEPVSATLVQFVQGGFEPLAVALLIAGVVTVGVGCDD